MTPSATKPPDERQSGDATARTPQWRVVPRREIARWNERLRQTSAHLYQYPLWNEALRRPGLRPKYLCYNEGTQDAAFACVLTLGIPGFRYGVVRCGPVSLGDDDDEVRERAITQLVPFLGRLGYMCVRFSSTDAKLRARLASAARVEDRDTFPFLGHYDHELVVPQESDDEELLMSFSKGLRYDIRKARDAGFTVARAHDVESLRELWPLVEAMDERKGRRIYRRSLHSYEKLVDLAAATEAAAIYSIWVDAQPVQLLLLVRDRETSHYVVGAMDLERLGGRPSPSAFLHWTAMREASRAGVKRYNLGTEGDEGLRVFKMKFRPTKLTWEAPFTLILRPRRHSFWTWTLRRLRQLEASGNP